MFQGVQAVWRDDAGVYAEVAISESVDGFGVHPALLDAALHPSGLLAGEADTSGPRLPFAWSGVELFAVGATALRVAIRPDGDGVQVQAADGTGQPVAVVRSLISRTVSTEQLPGRTKGGDALFAVAWIRAADDRRPRRTGRPHDADRRRRAGGGGRRRSAAGRAGLVG